MQIDSRELPRFALRIAGPSKVSRDARHIAELEDRSDLIKPHILEVRLRPITWAFLRGSAGTPRLRTVKAFRRGPVLIAGSSFGVKWWKPCFPPLWLPINLPWSPSISVSFWPGPLIGPPLKAQWLKTFQSRLKSSISLEIFQSWSSEFSTKKGVWWVARLKFSISLENFNPRGRSWMFFNLWPLGSHSPYAAPSQLSRCQMSVTIPGRSAGACKRKGLGQTQGFLSCSWVWCGIRVACLRCFTSLPPRVAMTVGIRFAGKITRPPPVHFTAEMFFTRPIQILQ